MLVMTIIACICLMSTTAPSHYCIIWWPCRWLPQFITTSMLTCKVFLQMKVFVMTSLRVKALYGLPRTQVNVSRKSFNLTNLQMQVAFVRDNLFKLMQLASARLYQHSRFVAQYNALLWNLLIAYDTDTMTSRH